MLPRECFYEDKNGHMIKIYRCLSCSSFVKKSQPRCNTCLNRNIQPNEVIPKKRKPVQRGLVSNSRIFLRSSGGLRSKNRRAKNQFSNKLFGCRGCPCENYMPIDSKVSKVDSDKNKADSNLKVTQNLSIKRLSEKCKNTSQQNKEVPEVLTESAATKKTEELIAQQIFVSEMNVNTVLEDDNLDYFFVSVDDSDKL